MQKNAVRTNFYKQNCVSTPKLVIGMFKTLLQIIKKEPLFTVWDPYKLIKFKFQFSQPIMQKEQVCLKICFPLGKHYNDYIKV